MFLPMFLLIEGYHDRVPLQKILKYRPCYPDSGFPSLKIIIDARPPIYDEIKYNTKEELDQVIENLDRLCCVMKIPMNARFDFPSDDSSGPVTLQ